MADHDPALSCSPLNSSTLITNTSSTLSGTYVRVQCIQGYQVSSVWTSGTVVQPEVFRCLETFWIPSLPRCVELAAQTAPAGVVIGCSLGALLCVVFIIVAFHSLCKTRDESLIEKEENQLQAAKNLHIDYFISSFQRDVYDITGATTNAGFEFDPQLDPHYDPHYDPQVDHHFDPHFDPHGATTGEGYEVNMDDEIYCSALRRRSESGSSSSHHGSMDSITSAGDLETSNITNV